MAPRALGFPTGTPAQEIQFLLDFVNGDWDVWRLDSLREVFLHVNTIDKQKATDDSLLALRDEARECLLAVVTGSAPAIGSVWAKRTVDDRGRARHVPAETDFSSRVRLAVDHLRRARRHVRACIVCEDFYFPSGVGRFCARCANGRVAEAIRLDEAQERTRRSRARKAGREAAQRVRLEKRREDLIDLIRRDPSAANRYRLHRVDETLAAFDRADVARATANQLDPPSPKKWKITVSIGFPQGGVVNVNGTPMEVPPTPNAVESANSGEYAEILAEYRSARASGFKYIA